MTDDPQGWRFDRRVPVALLLGLGIQFAAFVYAYALQAAQVEENSRRIAEIETVVKPLGERLARIEVKLDLLIEKQRKAND